MLRHGSRSLFSRASAASMRWRRQFSTDLPAETTGDPKFTEFWKKTMPNMEPPRTPTSYMDPRPPTPSTIPSKLTVNFFLPYDSILAAKEVPLTHWFMYCCCCFFFFFGYLELLIIWLMQVVVLFRIGVWEADTCLFFHYRCLWFVWRCIFGMVPELL